MRAVITNFKVGGKSQDPKRVILTVEGVTSYAEASRLIGRKVVWRSPISGESFRGKIVKPHGKKGRVVAVFRKPLPGQALGTEAWIL